MDSSVARIFELGAQGHAEKRFHFPSTGASFTYAELHEQSRRVAAALRGRGVGAGSLVGLLFDTSPEFVAALFGTFASGATAVPLPQPSAGRALPAYVDRLGHILRDGRVRHVLVGDELASLVALPARDVTVLRVEELVREDVAGEDRAPSSVDPSGLALVQYTSGSTSDPKGVALTHANLVAGLRAIIDGIRLEASDVNGQWLPLHHDMGLIGLIAGTMAGVTHHLWSPASFIRSPARWLAEFAARRATIYAGPNFSYASMLARTNDEQLRALDLSAWRIAFNGAEVIDVSCLARFTDRFAAAGFRRETMLPVYGLAEATLAATFPRLGALPRADWVDRDALSNERTVRPAAPLSAAARGVAIVGRPVLDHEIRITGPDGATLGDDRVGEIELRGPAVMGAYLGRTPEESGIREGGWLATGDLGYLRDGELRVTGRVKEMIIVRGANFYPHDVERVASRVAGANNAIAFSSFGDRREQMVVMVEANRDIASSVAGRVHDAVLAELGLSALEVCVVKPRTIGRTTSGKFQRVLMRERFASGALDDAIVATSRPLREAS